MSDITVPGKVRAWYGLSGEILVENELWHLVRLGPISLPHPPLINLFLRAGLPKENRLRLSFEHEYGHLQTLPLALLHLALLRPRRASLGSWLAALIAHQAVWELAAEGWVVAKHALRNAMVPIVSIAALTVNRIIGATVVVESIFALPGLGRMNLESVLNRDFPTLQGAVLLMAIIVVAINLVSDLVYGWVDPRIRYS